MDIININFYIKKNFFIMTFSKNISNIIFSLYQELPEIEPLGEELSDDKDEEVPEIASFTSRFHIKNIIHFNVPVEYPSTSPEGVATIFHIADWTDSSHAQKNVMKILNFN